MRKSAKILGITLLSAGLICFLIWYVDLHEDNHKELKVVFLPSGPVFIRSPSGRSVLINGGSGDAVLRELGDVLPFYQRSIDVVIAAAQTPSDVGGLASVIARYDIPLMVRSAAHSSAPEAAAFTGAVSAAQQKGSKLATFQRSQALDLGDGVYIEVFFPDRDASQLSPSDGCLMLKLVFGETSFFFACGSPAVDQYVTVLDGTKLRSDVLIGSGAEPEIFLGFVAPQFAVVPCGTIATSSYQKLRIQTSDACDKSLTYASDGQSVVPE